MVQTAGSVDVEELITYIKSHLIVAELKGVLKAIHLPTSGLKKALQDKLSEKLREYERRGEWDKLRTVENLVKVERQENSSSMRQGSLASSTTSSGVGGYNGYNTGFAPTPHRPVSVPSINGTAQQHRPTTGDAARFTFKPSPFYTVLDSLSAVVTVPAATHTRSTLRTNIALSTSHLEQLRAAGSEYRVLLFCAEWGPASIYSDHIVSFPQQCEIKVGDTPVQANTRGLRKRVGTTKPVDLTSYMSLSGPPNVLYFTYALTKQKFQYVVKLVKNVSVGTLVKKLENKPEFISKESVLESMRKENEESDIVATSTNMTLRCPLSTLRIQMPIRSKNCTHNQCFDAHSYIELQTQAPVWTCPVCSKNSPYELLVVDKYVQDILDKTPKDVESVRVDPDGNWSIESRRAESIDSDSEDEKPPAIKLEQPKFVTKGPYTPDQRRSSQLTLPTPPQPSTPINGTTNGASAGQKRTHELIDLTLSDDDEPPPPPRPQKRVNDNSFPPPNPSATQYSGGAGSPYQSNGQLTESHLPLRFHLPSVNQMTQYRPPPPPTLPPPSQIPRTSTPPPQDPLLNWQSRDFQWG